MKNEEARLILRAKLSHFENQPYSDLAQSIDQEFYFEQKGSSGISYQIEILILWDSQPNGAILVIGSIDDGGWRAFAPLTESMLIYPED